MNQARVLLMLSLASLGAGFSCSVLKNSTLTGPLDPDAFEPDSASASSESVDAATEAGADSSVSSPEACTVETCPRETVLNNLFGPVSIASSGTHLYFAEVEEGIPNSSNWGWLSRVPTDKSCTTRSCFDVIDPYLDSGELQGRNIFDTHVALGADHICYVQSFNAQPSHRIECVDLVTLKRSRVDSEEGHVVDLWVGGAAVRWAVGGFTERGSISGGEVTGGAAALLAANRVGVTSVASDGTRTYFTENGQAVDGGVGHGLVAVVGTDGGAVPLASNRPTLSGIAAYGGYVYWVEPDARKVLRTKSDGSGPVEQIATTDEKPSDLVVDATGVYWVSALYSRGTVSHAGLSPNGPVDVMLKGLHNVDHLAVDGTHVYASSLGATVGTGEIVRIKKTR